MESDERASVVFDQCEQDLSTNCLRLKHYRGHRRHLLRFNEVTIRMKSNTICKSFSGSFWSRWCTKGVKHAESRPIYPGYVEASLSGWGKFVTIQLAELFHIFFFTRSIYTNTSFRSKRWQRIRNCTQLGLHVTSSQPRFMGGLLLSKPKTSESGARQASESSLEPLAWEKKSRLFQTSFNCYQVSWPSSRTV